MGLFNLFNKPKTNYLIEMREYVKNFMLTYINEFPEASDDVIPVFSNVNEMLKKTSEKDICKMMKTNNVNIECGALNIIQNFAMVEMKPKSATSFIIGDDNSAFELYNYVNNLKYEKGYISKQQYDDNALLATKLSLDSPFGSWL